jgi:outer membrane biosynthesis protein TonB
MRRWLPVLLQLFSGFVALVSAAAQNFTPPPLLARPSPKVTPSVTIALKDFSKFATSHPTPEYPIEARRRHLSGKGVFELTLSENTGEVESVNIVSSTGHPILDDAAIKVLKQ